MLREGHPGVWSEAETQGPGVAEPNQNAIAGPLSSASLWGTPGPGVRQAKGIVSVKNSVKDSDCQCGS